MINNSLIEIFEKMAHVHEIRDAKNDFFRVRSYLKVAETIKDLTKDLTEYIDYENESLIEKIPGIGKAIEAKIIEFAKTNSIQEFEDIKKEIPSGLLDMLEINNLGPKKVKKFYSELGVDNLEKLKVALQDGSIASLKGMGQKSVDKILESLINHEQYSKRTPLGLISDELESIKKKMLSNSKCLKVEIAGSARRKEETIGDIDLLIACDLSDRDEIMEYFSKQDFIKQVEAKGDTKITARLYSGVQIDLRVVDVDQFGAALQYFTGSQLHNVALRTIAKKNDFKINEYGIFKVENEVETKVGGALEEDIYETLGMQFIPPELRQGNREIDFALASSIPDLIELKDIRGDLHCHSTYSDGMNSIEEMALKAMSLGYEYLAITDHSKSLHVAGGLDENKVLEKLKETRCVSEKLGFPVLCGTEVDILSDGSLDYSDDFLKNFDFVVASIHLGLDKDANERMIKAIKHPSVNMIGHPTTRLIGKRKGSELDWKAIFQACKEHNCFLEINGQPLRLDTPYQYVYEGIYEYGLKFAITSDAHSCEGLNIITNGVDYARRGWVKKSDIINTYSYKEFLDLIKKPNAI